MTINCFIFFVSRLQPKQPSFTTKATQFLVHVASLQRTDFRKSVDISSSYSIIVASLTFVICIEKKFR